MAVPASVASPATPAPFDPVLSSLATALAHTHAADPAYGLPFARALDRAVVHAAAGIQDEPYTATHYRVQSRRRAWLWHYVTLQQCSCAALTLWCWHRALLHLLTAQQALVLLDRCPRPTQVHVLAHPPRDYAAILRAVDEAGQLLGIELLDHLIIGQGRWLGLRERRLGFD